MKVLTHSGRHRRCIAVGTLAVPLACSVRATSVAQGRSPAPASDRPRATPGLATLLGLLVVVRRSALALLAISLLALAACSGGGPTDPFTGLGADLQRALDSARARNGGIGATAAVYVPGAGVWTGASGESYPGRAVTPDMIFALASLTKTFTATVVLQLADEGVLSLDDSLREWLPPFPYVDSAITIRQLLNHTSGLYSVDDNPAYWEAMASDYSRIWAPEEVLARFMAPPTAAPGTGWDYSNTNYVLLGLIIERASASTIASQFRGRLLGPLGMARTFFFPDEAITGEQVHRWEDANDDGVRDDLSVLYSANAHSSMAKAAGGMFSTVEDLLRLSRALHEGGLLSAARLAEMRRFVPTEIAGWEYGLGMTLRTNLFDGVRAYLHDGGTHGAWSRMAYLPDSGIHIAVLVNGRDTPSGDAITAALGRVALGHGR